MNIPKPGDTVICTQCNKNTVKIHPSGIRPNCDQCNAESRKLKISWGYHEFIPQSIKEGRKLYKKELLQPWRQGQISKEYLDAYPQQKQEMIKAGVITEHQARNAKEVWGKDVY